MMGSAPFVINLGGEGEVKGVLNQQDRWAILDPNWRSSQHGKTISELVGDGHVFLICDNVALAIPDGCVDTVITNSVPIDKTTWLGPGVQSSEIVRILKPGGRWISDGMLRYQKP